MEGNSRSLGKGSNLKIEDFVILNSMGFGVGVCIAMFLLRAVSNNILYELSLIFSCFLLFIFDPLSPLRTGSPGRQLCFLYPESNTTEWSGIPSSLVALLLLSRCIKYPLGFPQNRPTYYHIIHYIVINRLAELYLLILRVIAIIG